MSEGLILLEVDGGVGTLTLNRPAQRNALSPALQAEFVATLHRIAGDTAIRALVIAGAGPDFCAGGDLKALVQERAEGRTTQQMRGDLRASHGWVLDLMELEIPVVAAVHGRIIGAGLSIALAADFIVAERSARFNCAFTRVGLVPDLGCGYLLPRAVGLARAKDMVYSGRDVPATAAHGWGMVHTLVDGEVLAPAQALARQFAATPGPSIGLSKTLLNHSLDTDPAGLLRLEAALQGVCFETQAHQSAIAAFAAARPGKSASPKP